VNLDWERNMIQKLKSLAGAHYTNKMEKMVMDNSMQAENEDLFKEYCDSKVNHKGTDIKLEVQVLTRSNWPAYSVTEMKVPPEVQAGIDKYVEFYSTRHERTVLSWIHTLGKAQVELQFVEVKRCPLVTLSIIQAAILLQFNSAPKITFSDLCRNLGLTDRFLKKYIASMAILNKKHPERQLLVAEQSADPKDVSGSDVFILNPKLAKAKPKTKYSMEMLEAKVDGQEQQRILAKLQQERVMNIDAQIVRIMKARQRMKRGPLVMQVVEELKYLFPVQVPFVNGRIQVLAEGAYDEGQILKPLGDDEYEYQA